MFTRQLSAHTRRARPTPFLKQKAPRRLFVCVCVCSAAREIASPDDDTTNFHMFAITIAASAFSLSTGSVPKFSQRVLSPVVASATSRREAVAFATAAAALSSPLSVLGE